MAEKMTGRHPNKTYQNVPEMYQFLPPAGNGRGVVQ